MTTVLLGLPGRQPARGGDGAASAGRPRGENRLVDRHGRVATDLRVSLTDRCSLRCSYCMPAEGLDWLPRNRLLTDDEVIRLVTLAVERLGVEQVRFTGGEPLLRRGLERIVAATAGLRTLHGTPVTTALTTNGVGLARRAQALADAGLARVNVSLDTLRADRFARITHRDRLDDVLAGLRAARAAGLRPVKVNAVLVRGVNDDEAPDLLDWALAEGYELRFIEQMPLDAQGAWTREQMVTVEEILAGLRERHDLVPAGDAQRGTAPAQTWYVTGPSARAGRGGHTAPGPVEVGARRRPTVGVIASVSRPFCGDCDRTRLTADGQVRDCLFARTETDLLTPLRAGAGDERLADLWRTAMWGKRAGHGIDDETFRPPARPMSAIGG